jgi:type IX secretion system PorP/SprF family membrane protein
MNKPVGKTLIDDMMILRHPLRIAFAFVLTFVLGTSNGQDIHFTMHHMTPLAFNPANTGGFYGSYRLSGLYRDQYRSVAGSGAFMTPTFSVDVPVIRGFKEKDWVGVGMFFYSDKSGTGGLTQSSFKVSAAYHLTLNKKGTSILAIAYQTGSIQREIKDVHKLQFEDALISGGASPDLNIIDNMKKGFLDHVGGVKFTSKYNKTDEFNIGFAAGKFGKPNWSVITTGGNYRVDPRVHVQVGMSTLMTDKVRFLPNISYQKIMGSPANTLVLQGLMDYLYDKEKGIVLKGGLGYRSGDGIGDAIQIMLGADIKEVRVMLGYDLNISGLSVASGSQGGFELAAQYIGRIYKRPKPDPIIFCPRF